MARAQRILVVYKKDPFQQYIQEQQDSHLTRLLQHEHPDTLDMQRAHLVHEESMDAIVHALRQLPVEFDLKVPDFRSVPTTRMARPRPLRSTNRADSSSTVSVTQLAPPIQTTG